MSTIGSTSVAGINLAGSIVGSSRPEAATDRQKAASADQKGLIDRRTAFAQSVDDVADPEFGSDRDADGRTLYHRPGDEEPVSAEETEPQRSVAAASHHAVDAFGDCGKQLDIEA